MNDGTPIIIKKKKGHGGHGHHGGSWKVAYADFVTAMMAFFMVMWIMGLSDSDKAQVQGYFNDPMGFSKTEPMSKNIVALKGMAPPKSGALNKAMVTEKLAEEKNLEQTEAEIKGAIKSDPKLEALFKNIETDVTEEGLRIEFVESAGAVFFKSGGSTILPDARKLIAHIGPVIAKSGRRLIIEGHTDARPYQGSGYDNWDLSTDRAAAMRRELMRDGVQYSQFLQVRGYADTKLRFPDQPYHFANRRVSVLLPIKPISDEQSDLPKEVLKEGIQGVFRAHYLVAPQDESKSHP